ncbi:DUF2254 domain-containing protein [Microbacterium sp.]|uniref:DUF2254 domain-containing protein n=1 Tax=Microbacterium sp. TaxID=51671 RepID=UPI0039E24DE8
MTLHQRRRKLGGELWVMPLLFALGALVLGSVVSLVQPPPDSWLAPLLFQGSAEEARRLLIACATSIVGVLALVVGLTMVALQMAANRYSPRLLRNFIRDRTTQLVIAVFVGAFTYNAAGLFTVGAGHENGEGEYPRLAVALGLLLLFVCIAALVFYLDRMVHAIQIERVLTGISQSGIRSIADQPPGVGGDAGSGDLAVAAGPPADAVPVLSSASGYIEFIAPRTIVTAAERSGATVLLESPVGAHIVAGTPIAWVWPPEACTDELRHAIAVGIEIGLERSRRQDISVGFHQIVDIGVLAIHNFDYNTGVQCINELSVLLCELARLPLGPVLYKSISGTPRVILPARNFNYYMDIACGQILRRGVGEPAVLRALLGMLCDVATIVAFDDRRRSVKLRIRELIEGARETVHHPAELARLEALADKALASLKPKNAVRQRAVVARPRPGIRVNLR